MSYSQNETIKLIVMNNNMEDAVKDLIDMNICVSKSEAKRVYHQIRSINNQSKRG